ncbi:MAG TPA: hypothetical protein VEA69_14640 [Tepidisphaeraceae bacterium]|nr:hypothetical protein [Tepidisphaeraceae bacterium]
MVVPHEAARGGRHALLEADQFFMKTGPVFETLRRISSRLSELGIPYAVAGGMAVSAHGAVRTTDDVDILVTPEGLAKLHAELEGLGYVPPFPGSKNLKDTATAKRVEFLVTGQFPGDGKPKPVAFPDPQRAGTDIDGVRYLALAALLELKLASGMTGVGRYKDLGDVIALIQGLHLPLSFGAELNPYVRERFESLWHEAQAAKQQDEG